MNFKDLPPLNTPMPEHSGIFVGIAGGKDGAPYNAMILLDAKPDGDLNWKDALAWAEALGDGAHVPSRDESALLYANSRELMDTSNWHWTSTPYTRAHINACSPKRPMHPKTYLRSLFDINAALESIRIGAEPKLNNWIALAAMVNIMDALKQQSKITDDDGLITDAVTALSESSTRAGQGKAIRLDGKGIQAVNALMLDYTACCQQLPEQTIKSAINYAFELQTQLKAKERKAAQEKAAA